MNSETKTNQDFFELKDIFNYLLKRKKTIGITTIIFAVVSIIFALSIPNQYTSTALLSINKNNFSQASPQSFSPFSNISGLLVPSEDYAKSIYGIEIFKSRELIFEFAEDPEVMINLFAAKDWDSRRNVIDIDESLFDTSNKKWVREVSHPKKQIPSKLEAHEKILKEILEADIDEESGFVLLSVTHVSPYVAKDWAIRLIDLVNDKVRKKDIDYAENSIEFLKNELKTVEVEDVRKIIFDLIESQISTISLANANQEYLFDVIDAPVVAEEKSGPSRAIICIFITIFGFILGLLISISADILRKIRQ